MFQTHNNTIYLLSRLNTDLKEVILIAESDFVKVNNVLRSLYERHMHQRAGSISEPRLRLDAIMTGLQYMDVLSQRINHLIATHEKMTSLLEFRNSFFHLHVFQSLTIRLDLLRSITSIQESIAELKSHIKENGVEMYFTNTARLNRALQNAIDLLTSAAGDIRQLPIPRLTEKHIDMLSSLYTMDKERIVLNWFKHALPTGTWNDLLQHYTAEASVTETDGIELF
jgi:hypothetical protein